MEFTIQTISYDNPADRRILKACLSRWFENPKDLNFTDPILKFPFRFSTWVKRVYEKPGITTFVAVKEDWIVGHLSLMISRPILFGHLFHLFVDRNFLQKGIGTAMITHTESFASSEKVSGLTLNVVKKNKAGIRLYENLGYEMTDKTESGSLIYKKLL